MTTTPPAGSGGNFVDEHRDEIAVLADKAGIAPMRAWPFARAVLELAQSRPPIAKDAAPAATEVDTAPMYKALMEARIALSAHTSGAGIRAIAFIDKVLAATPATAAGGEDRPINCGTGHCSCIECLFDKPAGAGGAGVMDARPETMEIRYETFGNCLWHTDCKVNSFKSGVMQVHEKTSSTMKCLSCGQVGAYPKGRVGTVCVPVISTDAAILASKGGDQGEGK